MTGHGRGPSVSLLCFGGPLNEQLITIPADSYVLEAPAPDRWIRSGLWMLPEDPMPEPVLRTVIYRRERYWLTWPGDWWLGECLIVDGYPKHCITDALYFLATLTLAFHGSGRAHGQPPLPRPMATRPAHDP